MEAIFRGFQEAFRLIAGADRELVGIILLSFQVSGLALTAATVLGLPLSAILGFKRFWGQGGLITLLNTFMGLPPVVVGLFLYLILSRSGPLGFMGLLYTPWAMVLAQTILAFPIVASLCHAAIVGVNPLIREAARTLGATPIQVSIAVIREARFGILSGIIAALGRVLAEVGAILMVGGNIAGYTRVMTTTIALETDKGNFELALALGIILLLVSLIINLGLHFVQKKGLRPNLGLA
jgi:tungstate transport system permease protein